MAKLSAVAIRVLKPGRHYDGGNLFLEVNISGSRSWIIRVQCNGKRRDIGLGSFPTVSLAQARERAAETRKQVREGVDPVAVKRASRRILEALPTFRDAAERVHAERKDGWENKKHHAQWITTLKTYAYPTIGDLPINKVTARDVREVLLPIWQAKPETARRILQRIGTVLDWGHNQGHCTAEAPLRSIRVGLTRQNQQPGHFASLPYEQVADLMKKLSSSDTAGRLALRFLILTAARSAEVRGAKWAEIDLGNKLWTVPSARMKARKVHRVPLSDAAVEVLTAAAKLHKGKPDDPIFPGLRDKPLSDATMTKVLRAAIGGSWTVHGFRSSFRVWAALQTTYRSEVAEAALAHAAASKVVAAYLRTDYLDDRQLMMQEWATYVGDGR